MADVRLNIWISEEAKDYLEQRKNQENKPGMNVIVEELVRADMARRQGSIIEQQSLPAITETVRAEVRLATADLRRELRQDRELESIAERDFLRKHFDRVAGLVVHSIRNSGIGRRLIYSMLAKAYGVEFALEVFQDAKEKTKVELLPRKKGDQQEQGS